MVRKIGILFTSVREFRFPTKKQNQRLPGVALEICVLEALEGFLEAPS